MGNGDLIRIPVWMSYLLKDNIKEAITYFDEYALEVLSLQDEKFKKIAETKLEEQITMYSDQMIEIARVCIEKGLLSKALMCYKAIFKYNQKNISYLGKFIHCLFMLKDYDFAQELLEYLRDYSKEIEFNKSLAIQQAEKKDFKNAIKYMKKYIKYMGKSTKAPDYNLLGSYHDKMYLDTLKISHYKNAIKNFEKAAAMDPLQKGYPKNITIVAGWLNDEELVRKNWEKVWAIGGLSNDDKYDYAAFCLKNEDFEGFYKYFKARFKKENFPTIIPKFDIPQWDGSQDISQSTLLVYFEQGFGDTILMYGYLPRLVKIAKNIIYVVQDPLASLLKDSNIGVKVIAEKDFNINDYDVDYYIPSMEIFSALKLNRDNISAGEDFIKVKPRYINKFKKKYFNNDKIKIGISLSGHPNGNTTRDIPVKEFLPLDKLKNVELYCFTKDMDDDRFNCFKRNKINNVVSKCKDFRDTAAAMKNLDYLISSDNCIINLAGALGIKTYGLFNFSNEFRWFDLTGDNIIYLTSVKPFVNDKPNHWQYSMQKAINEIKQIESI